jgi:putative transcriptional regulator
MSKKYRSPAMAAVHEMMSDLQEAGVVDKVTMRHFDEQCLTPIQEMAPPAIVRLRKRERASQTVFARYLNITPSLVSQWERGEKRPNPQLCRRDRRAGARQLGSPTTGLE